MNSSESSRIADQMKRAFVGEAWHGPALMELLEGVTAATASAHPLAPAHSIWEIGRHITAWKHALRRRMNGEAVELTGEQDWPPVSDVSETSWIETIEELKRAHNELESAVAALDDGRLHDTVPGKDYDLWFMLHGAVQHDLYHAGQIALLKKS